MADTNSNSNSGSNARQPSNSSPAQNKKIYPSLTSFDNPTPSAQPQAAKQETPKPVSPDIKPAITEQKKQYIPQSPASAPQTPAYSPEPKQVVSSHEQKPSTSYQSSQPAPPSQPAGWQKQVSYEQKPSVPVSKPEILNQKPSYQQAKPSYPQEQKPSYSSNSQSQSAWKSQAGTSSNQAQPSWRSSYSNYNSQSNSSSGSNEKRGAPFRLYKATKANSGSAFSLDLNAEKQSIFIDVSKQIGEQKFDWEHKITMKLSITDIGKMLSVLTGSTKSAKLYHDPSKGQYESSKDTRNTVLEFSKGISFGYSLKASEQGTNGSVQSVLVPISEDEGEVVRVLLEAAIRRIYGW